MAALIKRILKNLNLLQRIQWNIKRMSWNIENLMESFCFSWNNKQNERNSDQLIWQTLINILKINQVMRNEIPNNLNLPPPENMSKESWKPFLIIKFPNKKRWKPWKKSEEHPSNRNHRNEFQIQSRIFKYLNERGLSLKWFRWFLHNAI